MASITVKIFDDEGSEVAEQAFRNPPKEAKDILDRLSAAGYPGALLDAAGYSLSGSDQVDGTQMYRVVLRAPSSPGMHYLWQTVVREKWPLPIEQQWYPVASKVLAAIIMTSTSGVIANAANAAGQLFPGTWLLQLACARLTWLPESLGCIGSLVTVETSPRQTGCVVCTLNKCTLNKGRCCYIWRTDLLCPVTGKRGREEYITDVMQRPKKILKPGVHPF